MTSSCCGTPLHAHEGAEDHPAPVTFGRFKLDTDKVKRGTVAPENPSDPLPPLTSHPTSDDLLGPTDSVPEGAVRIFVARKVVTVAPDKLVAEAVAVWEGKIICVGTKEECLAFAETRAVKGTEGKPVIEVDETFKDLVLIPGFVEAHGHTNQASFEVFDGLEG